MPTFRDINSFDSIPDSEVNDNMEVQVSSHQKVTLKQIAKLADASKGSEVLLDGYAVNEDTSVGYLDENTSVTQAFVRVSKALGAGLEGNPTINFRLYNTTDNSTGTEVKALGINLSNGKVPGLSGVHKWLEITDEERKPKVGLFAYGSLDISQKNANIKDVFSFQASAAGSRTFNNLQEGSLQDGYLGINEVLTCNVSTDNVSVFGYPYIDRETWSSVNQAWGIVILKPAATSGTMNNFNLSSIIKSILQNITDADSEYTCIIPSEEDLAMIQFTNLTKDRVMLFFQKLGNTFIVTASKVQSL